ncbi:DUF3139 domain-containing protein [Metabacillus malikii]|uniref:Uncharacterized protein YxeA n=1 Tax=Metabacillus malikii TaxID=1504265 RepID=A0ABT9ZB35_9BACI|nr:DUF3139 domain-containing protein [Metabacillus malikii]MDQ0229215.1 uncharacterized protein YxeA [Metabacillus malikii]
MKKSMWIAISVILILVIATPFVFIYLLNNGNPYTKYVANKNVPVYLEEQGYTESDIVESHYVEPKYTTNKDFYHGHYLVVFKDEPDVTYYYGITKKGKQVKQFCEKDKLLPDGVTDIFEDVTMHSEENCISSLENRN